MAKNVTLDSRLTGRSRSSRLGRERRGSGLKVVLALLAIAVVGFLVAVALQPAAFRISRSATMQAPASAVFAQVNDFHNWTAWNPWQKLDPTAKNTFSGPTSGVGSVFEWDGNDEVGAGRMTIVESRPTTSFASSSNSSAPWRRRTRPSSFSRRRARSRRR